MLSDKDISTYATLFIIALFAIIAVLLVVVITQRNKINQMQKPAYGFLGKPLMAFAFMAFSVGSLGVLLYSTQNSTEIDVTNADLEIELSINVQKVENTLNTFKISVLPIVNGIAWAGTDQLKFSAFWTISNLEGSQTDSEFNLSFTNPSGITKQLIRGKNQISVTLFYNNDSYSFEKEYVVE